MHKIWIAIRGFMPTFFFLVAFLSLMYWDHKVSPTFPRFKIDYASCIEDRSSPLHGPLYIDGKTLCKEDGFYTQKLDGIVYEFPSEQPFEGLIKYHDESDWKNPILLEWYKNGLLIKEMGGDEFKECLDDRTLKLLKYYYYADNSKTYAAGVAWDVCEASEEWEW